MEGNTNITIGTNDDEWVGNVNYSGLMIAQPSTTMKDEDDENINYNHTPKQPKGAVDRL